jgi:YD repeat-containing protein
MKKIFLKRDPGRLFNRARMDHLAASLPLAALAWLTTVIPLAAQTQQYVYDSMQRLKLVTYADGTTTEYVYDNLGNRLMETTTPPKAPPNSPPNAVVNPGIANGATNVSYTPVLTWPPVTDPDSANSVAYYVFFGTTPDPPLASSGWQTDWSPGQLGCFTTYYWYVLARDNYNTQSASSLFQFTTGDIPPLPDFTANPASGLAPLTVTFQDQSLYRCGALASWQWDFSNQGKVGSTVQNPTFTYSASGNYAVKLTVVDEHGGAATIVKTNFVSVLGPNIIELVPLNLEIQSAGPYDTLVVSYAVTNTGAISLSGTWQWSDWFYLSTNQVPDSTALEIASFDQSQTLPAGAVYYRTNLVPVTGFSLIGEYLCLNADGADALEEINPSRNVLSIPADTRLPDLVPSGLSFSGAAIAGQSINITYSVTNRGTLPIWSLGGSDVDFYDGFYLSTNAAWDATATPIGSALFSTALPAGAGYTQSGSATLPGWQAGNYWLLLQANDGGLVVESDMSNNTLAIPISVSAPDLVPVSIQAPQGVPSDAQVQVVYAVTNQGNAPALGFWVDTLYLSTNAFWDATADALAESFQEGRVPASASYSATNSFRLPGWPAGTYYLIVQPDSYGALSGGVPNNNVLAVPIALAAPAGLPDLAPISLVAPASVLPGASIQVVYGVTNSGGSPMLGEWFDELFFSTNAVWDATATFLGLEEVQGPVPKGGSYFETNTVTVPTVPAGTYYLIVQVNVGGLATEATLTNNTLASAITVQPPGLRPDLAVVSLLAPGSAEPGQNFRVVYAVTNQGGGAASGPWFDALVLSSNATPAGAVAYLGFWTVDGPVGAGSGYANTNTDAFVPSYVADGNYYLVLSVDYLQSVNESTRTNNVLALPFVVGEAAGPTPPWLVLAQALRPPNGAFQFAFTNRSGASFSVFSTTNLSLPFALWTALGNVTEVSPGQYQFTDLQAKGSPKRFYRVRSP